MSDQRGSKDSRFLHLNLPVRFRDPRKRQITIQHLLQMRSSYPWEESDPALWDALWSGNYLPQIVYFPLVDDPGTEMHYSNLSSDWLAMIVARACDTDLKSFAEEYLFSPIGAEVGTWTRDQDGYHMGHGEIHFTARDMAKFGWLYVNEGKFEGNQIISADWVRDSLQTYSEDAWDHRVGRNFKEIGYGYLWWSARAGDHDFNLAWGHGGQLTELRAADLRFTTAEAAEFLNQVMGLDLSVEDIAALEVRTEGWIAGLQLASLVLQGTISTQGIADTSKLIQAFTGSHRFVLDYLVDEVLNQQPQSIQDFLLQTAILNRLTGSLCDALTGQDDGHETLEYLDRANLFIFVAERGGRTTSMIEILMLQALAFQKRGDTGPSISALKQSLTLAEPEGFVRTFVDEGPKIAHLLYEALSREIAPEYIQRLLAAFPATKPEKHTPPPTPKTELIEPLSDREIEVLQLLAEGLTNREIASRLYLSLNTIKVHTRNIYGKLDVNNRTQAIAKGRALGILTSN